MDGAKLGFFGWIREGVRRAVLMGLSDAVEQIGAPSDKEEIAPSLLAVLRNDKPGISAETGAGSPRLSAPFQSSRNRPERKRLGKSLGETGAAPMATTPSASPAESAATASVA